jgi:hypothetical protein
MSWKVQVYNPISLPTEDYAAHMGEYVHIHKRYEFAFMQVAQCFKPHHSPRAYHKSRENSNDCANKFIS